MPPRWPRGRTSRRDGAQRGRPLEDDLPEEQHEHARDVEAVGEERAVAGVRLLLGLHPADREDHVVGLAREQVAAARAAVAQQADARRVAALDLGAVGRRRAGHQPPGLLLDPAERRDVLVRAEQDPGLAGARSARRGRSPTRRAGSVPSASQRAISGALPSRIARRSTGSASPSISRKMIPGTSVRSCAPWRRAIRWITRSVYVSSSFVPRTTWSTIAHRGDRRARRAAPTRTSRR